MRIRTRLLLVLAVPTLLLISGMTAQAASHLRARTAAAETARQAALVLTVQNLVHALQRERTLLTALHAGDSRVRGDLTTARLATGRSRAALSQLLAAAPPAGAAPDAAGTPYVSVRQALARLPTLDRARTATPALPLAPETPAVPGGPPRAQRSAYGPETPMIGPFGAPITPAPAPGRPSASASAGSETVEADAAGRQEAWPGADDKGATGGGPATDRGPVARREVFQAFTDAITELTDASFASSPVPDGWSAGFLWPDGVFTGTPVPGSFAETAGLGDPALTRPARALETISRAKEAASRERAVVTAAYVTGGFRPSEYVAFLEARASMADALAAYRREAGPAGAAELARAQRSPQATRTARLERRALAAPPGTRLAVRPRTWLVASGAYVNALHSVQRSAGQELLARAVAVRERHTRHLRFLTGAGAAILLVMAALGTLLARSILRPLRRLTGEATALARHIAILEAEPHHPAGSVEPGGAHPAHLWHAYNASFPPAAAPFRGRRERDGLGHEAVRLQARGHLVPRAHRRDRERRPQDVLGAPTDSPPTSPSDEGPIPPSRAPHPPNQLAHRPDGLDRHETPDAALPGGPGTAHEGPRPQNGPDAGRETSVPGEEGSGEVAVRGEFPGRDSAAGPVPARADGGARRGEFGQLAGALMDLHEAAVRIAASRAAIRQDAAASLGGLGMRHRDLVHRQLTFISVLQRNESDPAVLARLCELDRLTSRLRRNSESLLVLTGTRGRRRSSEPVPVDEVLRAVLAEVEDHQRVALRVVGRADVRGPVVAEVAHMLAELLDNALGYSASDAEVNVVSRALESECRIMISDQGVGMTAAELATANARLRGEQSFLVTPTRCLGHHVVGRLAERLGVRVSLHKSPGGGVTALVTLPEELLAVRPAQLVKGSR
ncbi:nitrate- and nitrite sensing domain-containing protein [Nonomuraea sp. CA-218870]|uniref:sensor histidine kinase n=1 Tax=Nonomuraea sp. CA-218870 TaxID=3239998 RepID=UPI003D8A2418